MELKLKDGKILNVEEGKSFNEIVDAISKSLRKEALCVKLNGKLLDLSNISKESGEFEVITNNSEEAFHLLNHSCAHLMASAIINLFPNTKFAIGPAINEGFFYDMDLGFTMNEETLQKIEKEMIRLIATNPKFVRKDVSKKEALEIFNNNPFKVELIKELEDGTISIYQSGNFIDLCVGPHVENFAKLKNFKLLSFSGAYWRGDAKNQQLQRIYGVCFATKEALDAHLFMLEEAKKRDHRKLGKELDLFFIPEEGKGFPLLMPNGMVIKNELINYWRKLHLRENYLEIETPIILNKELWITSGHWDHYKENMYTVLIDEAEYAIKPMNCPGSILYYRNTLHSYKDLPLRAAELGRVHRHEASGALAGLFRVRTFIQDDAHIFLAPEQIKDEIIRIVNLIDEVYKEFGFSYHVELSTRPEDSFGSDEDWQNAEEGLKEALQACGLPYKLNPGDGAFYGPKIDFKIKDCIGRHWQCGTIQLDLQLPQRFDLTYIDDHGEKKTPIMIHRVVFGSVERFLGVLIEHFAGAFPLWLAPCQVNILPVNNSLHQQYCKKIKNQLFAKGIRCNIDDREEKLSYRIREAQVKKIPYTLVIGDKEVASNGVTSRKFGQRDEVYIPLVEFIDKILLEILNKGK